MVLDIGNGISVLVRQIEAVEYLDDFTSNVHTSSHTFISPMPKDVLVSLIESRLDERSKNSKIEDLLSKLYATNVTHRP